MPASLFIESYIRHVTIWRVFTCEPRSWKLQNGKGNRVTATKVENIQQQPPSTAPRFDLRPGLYSHDNIHLNEAGFSLLTDILRWQTSECPEDVKELNVPIMKDGKKTLICCKAFFKF